MDLENDLGERLSYHHDEYGLEAKYCLTTYINSLSSLLFKVPQGTYLHLKEKRLHRKRIRLFFCIFVIKMNIIQIMFFDNYKQHTDSRLRPTLFWEYDLAYFDWERMRPLVVQHVIERGRMDDFYAMLNMYGVEGVKESIRDIPYMNPKDMSFVCTVFELKKEELKCYIRQQSRQQHWNPVLADMLSGGHEHQDFQSEGFYTS